MTRTGHAAFQLPGSPAGWFALACALQLAIFAGDTRTPLGFAHGVLYAAPVLLGLLVRRHGAIWGLAALGIAGGVAEIWASEGRLPGVSDTFVTLNRVVGVGAVLLAGISSSVVLHLMRVRREAFDSLETTSALLEVSSAVGQLGGWRVELPAQVSHWSPEIHRLLDHPEDEPPDVDRVIDCYAPDHREAVRAAFQACVADGTPFDLDAQVLRRDGSRRWVRLVGQAVRGSDGAIVRVHGALQDIEAGKQAALALARSQAEWRELAESLPMMVWVCEVDGALSFMNRYSADYLGTSMDTLLGSGWVGFVHPDDQEPTLAAWAAVLQSGAPYEVEFRVRRADGAWRWHFARAVRVALPGGSHRWYGTAMDVQAMRDERQARAALSTRLVDTMESVTDAIFILDRDWRFAYVNRQAELLMERTREDLLGRDIWDEFPAARGTEFQDAYERCLAEQVTVRFEAVYGPLGKRFEVNAYPSSEGVVVYFRDVTEARRLAEQVQHAQRMDSLGQLTGGVAHDFNNLLTVILGNAETLSEAYAPDARQRLMADMIATAARRGAEMTQRLLAFARRQALDPRPTDVNQLVRRFAPLLERTLGGHIELEMVHAGGLWRAQVDPGQLEVALLNLAVNARDAMPEGGRLTIETANARLDEDYAAGNSGVTPGQYVMVAVSDTGHGIPADLLPRVFEPFFTTKEVGKGTGLGLPMVYGFAKQSQGHVAIYSEVDRGTTVRLYLPRLVGAMADEAVPAAPVAQAGDGEQVLLVEDDDLVRAFAVQQLTSLGYRVLEARNGPEALRELQAHPDVALLFTDVTMPGGMSGRQLADAARALRPGLPVLYASGYTENAIVHHGRLDPGVLLLGKPYLRAELASKLRQALGRRQDA